MLVDYIRLINATQKFKIRDDFEFLELDDVSLEELAEDETTPDHLEIWASVRIFYEGEVPDSYKALNLIIGDWVESHEDELTEAIHEKLKDHVAEKYPQASHELDMGESSIWLDQLDYMPRAEDEDKKALDIEIELVLDVDEEEEDAEE